MLVTLLLWATAVIPPATTQCYAPDGQEKKEVEYEKCPQNAMCCALGRSERPGSDTIDGTVGVRDECLPNGLCEQNHVDFQGPQRTWWRNFCTDSSWDSRVCLDVCKEESLGKYKALGGAIEVTPCSGNRYSRKWCCGGGKLSCCDDSNNQTAVTIRPILGLDQDPRSTLHSSALSISSVGESEPTRRASEPPGNESDRTELSTGARVGLAIGAIVGFSIILASVLFVVKALRWRKIARKETSLQCLDVNSGSELNGQDSQEMDARDVAELAATQQKHQLP
ncbi:hypothetical protein M011DRAFT_526705 [Sporormia fimetaria CBS 119925]|uniref:Mid2 domain-containing protein n=1 Tax=Sporormia fimetaria CBS 119925 TaxID=1340428 RepID=A0A6A6VD08_9PLEO|nr:hypothetical protein M011DRAFT_526705 [Sporormia fimetaria CBS 119925]